MLLVPLELVSLGPGTLSSSYCMAMPRLSRPYFLSYRKPSPQNRGASHRIAAYKIFQSLGYYTLTMDYRWTISAH